MTQPPIHPLLSTGLYQSVIVDREGSLWVSGNHSNSNHPSKIPHSLIGIRSVTSGYSHYILIDDSHHVWSFGSNESGQLGLGHTNKIDIPTKIEELNFPIRDVCCGSGFTMCIDFQNQLWSFGMNRNGQLGLGHSLSKCTPQKVMGLPPIKSLSCGDYHTLILDHQGFVWSVGYNGHGQLGIGNTINQMNPIKITQLSSIEQISSGYYHSFALGESGQIWAFGSNSFGELGLGHTNDPQVSPALIPNSKMKSVQCKGHSSFAMDHQGNWWSCGHNGDGELGHGDSTHKSSFTQLDTFPDGTVSISNGGISHHSILVDQNGSCWAFGYNHQGQLGLGHKNKQLAPTPLEPHIKVNPNGNHMTLETFWKELSILMENFKFHDSQKKKSSENHLTDDGSNTNQSTKNEFEFPPRFQESQIYHPDVHQGAPWIREKMIQGKIPMCGWDSIWNSIDHTHSHLDLKFHHLQKKLNQLNQVIEHLRLELQQKEHEQHEAQHEFDQVETHLNQFRHLNEILKPLSEIEPHLRTEFYSFVQDPDFEIENLNEGQVIFFLNLAGLNEMIPFSMENKMNGEMMSGYTEYDLKQFSLKIKTKFKYQRSMLEAGKFGNQDHLKSCRVCKCSSVDETISLIQEYDLPLNEESIRKFQLTVSELIFLHGNELSEYFGVTNEKRKILKGLKKIKKIHKGLFK